MSASIARPLSTEIAMSAVHWVESDYRRTQTTCQSSSASRTLQIRLGQTCAQNPLARVNDGAGLVLTCDRIQV